MEVVGACIEEERFWLFLWTVAARDFVSGHCSFKGDDGAELLKSEHP